MVVLGGSRRLAHSPSVLAAPLLPAPASSRNGLSVQRLLFRSVSSAAPRTCVLLEHRFEMQPKTRNDTAVSETNSRYGDSLGAWAMDGTDELAANAGCTSTIIDRLVKIY